MLALAITALTMPRLGSSAAKVLNAAQVTDTIWNLHSIPVNPASTPDEAGRAKQRMLRVLDEARSRSLLQVIVPAITFAPESAEDATMLLDDSHVCGTCKRPVPPGVRNRSALHKRERGSSSRFICARNFHTRRETASPNAACGNSTASR